MTEPSVPAVPIMSKAKARRLLDRIKTKADSLWADIVEAHDGGAWKAVGYSSWAECAELEFGKSRTHSYRLLAQARLMGELEAAAPTPEVSRARDRLSQRDIEKMDPETKDELAEKFRAAQSEEDAIAAVEEAKAAPPDPDPPPKKRTATHPSKAYEVQFVDPELTQIVDLAVAEQVPVEAEIVRLALIGLHVIETGEVPTFRGATPKQRERVPAPALEAALARREQTAATNGDACRHVASKPKSSGLVVCELCGLPRTRWAVIVNPAGAGRRVERRGGEVPTAFRGGKK